MTATKHHFQLIRARNYNEISTIAARIVIGAVKKNPNIVIGFATGSTPLGLYQQLILDYQANRTSYNQVRAFNLDEYIGFSQTNKNSYNFYMQQNLFHHIDIPSQHTFIPNGVAKQDEECQHYEELIALAGGIDLQILGLGANGHIGFNEPGTSFASMTHVVELAEATRKANAKFFPDFNDVPTHAITAGIATIMKSKRIILLVSGKGKANALQGLIEGDVTELLPGSVLRRHQHVTIIADDEALSLITC